MGIYNASIEEIARKLAQAHYKHDPATTAIYLVPDSAEIRLIEITPEVGNTGEILPFGFEASIEEGIPYPSSIVLLSAQEWEAVQCGQLSLPPGWGTKDQIVSLPKAS
jgi:hypothetical protein